MCLFKQKSAYGCSMSDWSSNVCSSDLGSSKSVDAIRNLTIPSEGSYVRLSDIAEVGDGQSEIRGFARLNGRPITAVQISKTKDESDVTVETRVLADRKSTV